MFRLSSLLLLLALVPPPPPKDPTILRFEKIAEGFYRGGQPDRAGFNLLKTEHKVKTVINLRDENDEEAIVKELGMRYIHLPMSVKPWTKISKTDIDKYFAILNDPASYPVFIHCRRGADRTGAMVALYRIAAQDWDGKKAVVEAREIGMRWWYFGLKDQIQDFAKGKTNKSLLTFKPSADSPIVYQQ